MRKKRQFLEDWEKSLGRGLADRVGPVIKTQVFFLGLILEYGKF